MTPKKALFGDLVIGYRTNLVVIVPKAFRTFHDQCGVHIRVFAMFTGTFRVKGGGRFRATTFCVLTVVFSVVVALLGAFSFNAILRSYFLLLLSDELSFSIKSRNNFLFLIKPLSIPNSASPSRNVFSARGLVTSLL